MKIFFPFITVVLIVAFTGILSPTYGQWQKHEIDTEIHKPVVVYAADIDNDHDLDLVAAGEQDDDVIWYENLGGTPISWTKHTIDGNLDAAIAVCVADIDRDGRQDLAATGLAADDVVWYENLGGTPISWAKYYVDENLDGAAVLCIADIDRDRNPDIAATGLNADAVVWYENSGGTPISWTKRTIDGNLDGACSLDIIDMDDDGDKDLVVTANNADEVVWYENLGGTPISWTKHTIDGNLDYAFDVNAADIDGDDDQDVVATGFYADDVVWYENLGGTPISWSKHTIDGNLNGARDLYIADIDGDDTLDVVVTAYYLGDVVWYENLGGTPVSWSPPHTIDENLSGANDVIAADIDGDSYQDVVASGFNANKVVWYTNFLTDIGILSERISTNYELFPNFPNPFNPLTKIKFSLPKPETVKIEVYNIIGQKIATLLNKSLPAGYHEIEFNGHNLSSAVYLYRIEAGQWQDVKKMVLLR